MTDLVCPYCGSSLSLEYVFDGGSYSEFRSVGIIECDNYECWATWDRNFRQTQASKLTLEATGGREWASRNNEGARLIFPFSSKEAADKETARFPQRRKTVTRFTTPWKEAS